MQNAITDVPGISVGHAHDEQALTGCTVILCPKGAVGGVDQRGGAPGTRETDALRPMHLVNHVHGILLTGGSAFGLNAAAGLMQFLEEKGVGFNAGDAKVPIVPAAVLYDLGLGDARIRPDASMGYQACINASTNRPEEGNFGAGIGATAGKLFGIHQATKTGIGTASITFAGGIIVGAIAVANPFGDVIDPTTGGIIAGTRPIEKGPIFIGGSKVFVDSFHFMQTNMGKTIMNIAGASNTVIGVVATNAKLNREQTNKVAQMAQDGIARTIRPSHSMYDGDTIFALATGERKADVSVIGAAAAEVFAWAIISGVRAASSVAGLPCSRELLPPDQIAPVV